MNSYSHVPDRDRLAAVGFGDLDMPAVGLAREIANLTVDIENPSSQRLEEGVLVLEALKNPAL